MSTVVYENTMKLYHLSNSPSGCIVVDKVQEDCLPTEEKQISNFTDRRFPGM